MVFDNLHFLNFNIWGFWVPAPFHVSAAQHTPDYFTHENCSSSTNFLIPIIVNVFAGVLAGILTSNLPRQ